MANIFLTPTAEFKPFSYAEMLAPIAAYQEAYDNLETELSNLDILAGSIEGKLNKSDAEDQKLLEIYKSYQKDMESALNDFYNHGYTTDVKRKFNTLKTTYAKKLDPISQAYERRLEDMKFIRQQKIDNPQLIVEGIGNSTSAYMNGNTPNPVVVNLNTATEAAKNASTGLSKQFIDKIGLQGVDGHIGYYLMHGVVKGIDDDMVRDFTNYVEDIKNNQDSALQTPQGEALYNMFEQIRTANNYDALSEEGKERLDAAIIQGLVSGAAADMDINYIQDNYWQIENEKLKYDINKAKLDAARNPTVDPDLTGLDLRTNTSLYKGANYDVSTIAEVLSTDFEPTNYNGTMVTNALQAYNIINQNSAKINSLQTEFNALYDAKKKALAGTVMLDAYGDPISIDARILADPEIAALNTELTKLKNDRAILQRDLGSISLADDEVNRIRSYTSERVNTTLALIENNLTSEGVVIKDSNGKIIPLSSADENSVVFVNGKQDSILTQDIALYKQLQSYKDKTHIGQFMPEELQMFAYVMDSDITTGIEAEKSVVVFDHNNSSKGLEDLVDTMSGNIIPALARKEAVKITDASGKPVKKKVLKGIIDSATGAIDPSKIQKVELDFTSAEKGVVKVTTTNGQILYVDARYLGDQASAFITGSTGITNYFDELSANYRTSKVAKAEALNRQLATTASSVQSAFDLNRNPSQSFSLSNKELKSLFGFLGTDEE